MLIVISIALLAVLFLALWGVFRKYYSTEDLSVIFGFISGILIAALIVCGIIIGISEVHKESNLASNQLRYESLVYQAEVLQYDNFTDNGKKQLADEIRQWNEDLAVYKHRKVNSWTNWFYRMDVDKLEFIPYDIMKAAI